MKIDRMSLPSLDTKCLIASYNFWSSLTGIPSVCLCASANVNPEQLLHSVNTLHEEQVCVWSQELEGSSPSPEHEEWNWTISEIQLNLCWTTALSHFSEVVFVNCKSPALHIWMQTDYTRSQQRPGHTGAMKIHEGIKQGRWWQQTGIRMVSKWWTFPFLQIIHESWLLPGICLFYHTLQFSAVILSVEVHKQAC